MGISGPTKGENNLVFKFPESPWINPYSVRGENLTREDVSTTTVKHEGIPEILNFDWILLQPAHPITKATGW